MRREDVIRRLKSAEPAIRARSADALYLFGTYARDEARSNSDIDVFVDKDPTRPFGFDEFMNVYEQIQQALGKDLSIGYCTREGLSPFVRGEIEKEAIKIF